MNLSISQRIRKLLIGVVITIQVLSPVAVLAQEISSETQPAEATTPTTPETTPETPVQENPPQEQTIVPETQPVQNSIPPEDVQGPTQPTGPESRSYTWNPDTGLWENDYYTWDPVTKQTKPKTAPTYSYNPDSGMWDTTEWYYSPEQGKYLPNTVSTGQNPAGNSISNTGPDSTNAINGGSGTNSISNTGPDSNNTIDQDGNTTGNFDLFFDASISNKIGQMSQTGNAYVQGNTFGGNATTGDATAMLNLLNMIQSSWGGLGSEDVALFMANLNGNVVGDLFVDPSNIKPGSGNTDLDVTVAMNAAIDNDIDVDVASGNAIVSGNTTGGNASSGNANAVVNLMNLINSAITAGKSFVGVLNINGNLNGDILLPPEMLSAIIAATGPNSNNQINDNKQAALKLNVNDQKTINNNINTDVGSGNAAVTHNTTGGNATTGNANSNIVLLNLTGQKVVAKNAMLVFVNVLGNWVGLIMDAPSGTNAVAVTGPNSSNTINSNKELSVDVDVSKQSLINNDINVAAHSGDATVSGNTTGGNATTGDAEVGVNVLNMIDSQFDITDWFGVLFINVFGEWIGSFGINTAAGDQPAGLAVGGRGGSTESATQSAAEPAFAFVPKPPQQYAGNARVNNDAPQTLAAVTEQQPASPSNEQASSASSAPYATTGGSAPASNAASWWLAGLATFIGALMLGGERIVSMVRSRPG